MPGSMALCCKWSRECAGNVELWRSRCLLRFWRSDGTLKSCDRERKSIFSYGIFLPFPHTQELFLSSPSIFYILLPGLLHSRACLLEAKVKKKNSVPLPAGVLSLLCQTASPQVPEASHLCYTHRERRSLGQSLHKYNDLH